MLNVVLSRCIFYASHWLWDHMISSQASHWPLTQGVVPDWIHWIGLDSWIVPAFCSWSPPRRALITRRCSKSDLNVLFIFGQNSIIRTCRESQCLPYAGFFFSVFVCVPYLIVLCYVVYLYSVLAVSWQSKGGDKKTRLFIHILWISVFPPPRWRIL